MGKIRIRTIGDTETEKKQQEEARKRAEVKRAEKTHPHSPERSDGGQAATSETQDAIIVERKNTDSHDSVNPSEESKTKTVSKYKAKTTKNKRSDSYQKAYSKVDKNKIYKLSEALTLLPQLKLTKYDESVELHINTTDKGVSGSVTLPHGTGKKTRVAIADYSENPKGVEELIKKVESGIIDFEILIATPDSMPKLAKVARFLGPRGLMPNPKNGTVTQKPTDSAKKYEGGHVNYKTEAKFPILHMLVGKLSFGQSKLEENIKTAIDAIQTKNIKTVTLKSTMSPGLRINFDQTS